MKRTLIALAAAACSLAHAQTIERVRMSDNDLSCRQIVAEASMMDSFIARSAALPSPQMAAPAMAAAPDTSGVGGQVAQQAFAQLAARGGLGSLGSLFSGGAAAPAQQVAQAQALQQAAALLAAQQAGSNLATQNALAQQAAALAGNRGGNLGGFGGLLSGLVQAAGASQQAVPAAAAMPVSQPASADAALGQQAQVRKEHLTNMFLSKGCKMSDSK